MSLQENVDRLLPYLEDDSDIADLAGTSPRQAAMAELVRQGPSVTPILIRRLNRLLLFCSPKSFTKTGIISVLSAMNDLRAVNVFIKALRDPDCEWESTEALQRVGRCEKAIGPLLDALVRQDPREHSGNSRVIPLIEALLSCGVKAESVSRRLRGAALIRSRWRLGQFRHRVRTGSWYLRGRIDVPQYERSYERLLQLLGKLDKSGDVPSSIFLQLADHSDMKVRLAAIRGIGNVLRSAPGNPDPKSTETLVRLAKDGKGSDRGRALKVLTKAGCRHQAIMEALDSPELKQFWLEQKEGRR